MLLNKDLVPSVCKFIVLGLSHLTASDNNTFTTFNASFPRLYSGEHLYLLHEILIIVLEEDYRV